MVNLVYVLSWHLLEIYMTEVYHFAITQSHTGELSLPAAMSCTDEPYIQTLAMIDLAYASVYSKYARAQLFSLNYKSGQPTNWIRVSHEALRSITNFMEIFNFDDMLHGSARHTAEKSVAASRFTHPIKYITGSYKHQKT